VILVSLGDHEVTAAGGRSEPVAVKGEVLAATTAGSCDDSGSTLKAQLRLANSLLAN